jgi:peptidoglycan/LPS O-acetylase OafA/YrhL
VTCLGLFLILNKSLLYPNLIFASGLALLIVGFVIREKLFKPTWPIFLMMMGNASYSVYLVHGPLMSVTQRLLGSIGLSWGGGGRC